jgi:hypothetical protein
MEMVIKIGSKQMSVKLLILIFGCTLIGVLYLIYSSNRESRYLNKTYHLVSLEELLNGEITDIFFNHLSYLTINDSVRVSLFGMENPMYKPSDFYKFVQYKDRIIKHSGSDTIYLYRRNQQYFFILNELNIDQFWLKNSLDNAKMEEIMYGHNRISAK